MANAKLIPDGVRDERAERLLQLLERWDDLPIEQLLVYRVDQAELDLLRQLAWQFHVMGIEGWDIAETRTQRRELVRRAMLMHARKGTPWAIKAALQDAGYGGATIEERLPLLRHDASANYSGARKHGGGSHWARFRVRLDVGEQRGITSESTDLAIRLIEAWKNARSHLADLTYEANVADAVEIDEEITTALTARADDLLPWGRRYNGAIRHDQATRRLHDGALSHDGAARYTSWVTTGEVRDNQRDAAAFGADVHARDRVGIRVRHDGRHLHAGIVNHGADQPPATDRDLRRTAPYYDGRQIHRGFRHGAVWPPASDIIVRPGLADAAPDAGERFTPRADLEVSDAWPYRGHRHDGRLRRDQATRLLHDGAIAHDGAARHAGWLLSTRRFHAHDGRGRHDGSWGRTGWIVPSATYDTRMDAHAAAGAVTLSDRPAIRKIYDGRMVHSGFTRGSAPSAVDPAMPITITRHRRHDGKYRHAGDLHDARQEHDGSRLYWMGLRYTGADVTREALL